MGVVGPCLLRPDRDRFGMLVRSITSQQISVHAARSILHRIKQLSAPERLTPQTLLDAGIDGLRECGVSKQKAMYLLDLSNHVAAGSVSLQRIGRHGDEAIIEQLTIVKGIGRWTAQMFLIFALGRMDIFPVDDLGVRSAIRKLYGLDELPDREACLEIGKLWRPYASVASWYCWRSLEQSTAAVAQE